MPSTIQPAAASPKPSDKTDFELLNESRELDRLVLRLQDQYSELSPEQVHTAVNVAVHAFDGAKVRHFVPLLVERMARESLDHVRAKRPT
jgi:hypothetical protein